MKLMGYVYDTWYFHKKSWMIEKRASFKGLKEFLKIGPEFKIILVIWRNDMEKKCHTCKNKTKVTSLENDLDKTGNGK